MIQTLDSSRLHKCPFCWGSNVDFIGETYDNFYWGEIQCRNCGASMERQGWKSDIYENLINAWNTRKGVLNVTMEEKYGRKKNNEENKKDS